MLLHNKLLLTQQQWLLYSAALSLWGGIVIYTYQTNWYIEKGFLALLFGSLENKSYLCAIIYEKERNSYCIIHLCYAFADRMFGTARIP